MKKFFSGKLLKTTSSALLFTLCFNLCGSVLASHSESIYENQLTEDTLNEAIPESTTSESSESSTTTSQSSTFESTETSENSQSTSLDQSSAENTEDSATIENKSSDDSQTNVEQDIYRLYNPNSGEHFYTSNYNERVNLVKIGWKNEGIGWVSPQKSSTPVHRLYNPNTGDHHYTTDENEKNSLTNIGWRYEGINWYSDDSKTVAVYRAYNPNAKKAGSHNYTPDKNEQNHLVNIGWQNEGEAWYALKGGRPDNNVPEGPSIPQSTPKLDYQVYLQSYGWQPVVNSGAVSGSPNSGKRLEAIKINIPNSSVKGSITYSAHVEKIGWQSYVKDSQIAGTTGHSLRLEALKIKLTGDLEKYYDVYYRSYIEEKGWLGWTKNDGIIGSLGAAKRMEALEIRLVKKGETGPTLGSSYATADQFHNPAINRNKLLNTAASFVSTYKYNPTNNIFTSKYNRPHNGWCTLFIEYVFDKAGIGSLFYGGRYEWDPQVVYPYHKARGQVVSSPQPGDIAFVDWQGRGHITHAEIVESVGGNSVGCITGNWGNMVTRVNRPKSQVVAYIRPNY